MAQTDFLNENTASFICELGRPKYNLGRPNWVDPTRPKHTRIDSKFPEKSINAQCLEMKK